VVEESSRSDMKAFSGISCKLMAHLMLPLVLLAASCQRPADQRPASRMGPGSTTAFEKPGSEYINSGNGTLATIVQRGELRVGMQVGYVPFQMQGPDGAIVGLDVDLADIMARSLKVNLKIVPQTWQEVLPSLEARTTDIAMSGIVVTPERNIEAAFTIPVLETGRMFLVHVNNSDRLKKLEDLDHPGIFIVSWPGGLGPIRFSDILPHASFRQFPDRERCLAEVLDKKAQGLIDDEFSIRLACATHPDKLVSNFKPVTYEQIAWAVRPGDSHWLNWLDNFIRIIQRDGRLDELKRKWLQDYFLDMQANGRKEYSAR